MAQPRLILAGVGAILIIGVLMFLGKAVVPPEKVPSGNTNEAQRNSPPDLVRTYEGATRGLLATFPMELLDKAVRGGEISPEEGVKLESDAKRLEQGLLALTVPQEYQGIHLDLVIAAAKIQEASRHETRERQPFFAEAQGRIAKVRGQAPQLF